MDIDKWYNSMIAEPSAKGIREMVEESDINFEGIDYDVISKYLGEFLTKTEIAEEGMEEILYIRREKDKKRKQKKVVKNVNRKQKAKGNKKSINKNAFGNKLTTLNINKDGGKGKTKRKTLDIQEDGGKDDIVNREETNNESHQRSDKEQNDDITSIDGNLNRNEEQNDNIDIRRIRNTKVELGESVRNKHLNDFMLK